MAVGKKDSIEHNSGMALEESKLFLQLKWYVEGTIGKEVSIPMFLSVVGRELENIAADRRGAISRLHMDYLLSRHAALSEYVGIGYAKEFHKEANNGHAASLYSLKRNVEASGLVDGADKLSWREAGAAILYVISSARWRETKNMLSTLIREDAVDDDDESYEYFY